MGMISIGQHRHIEAAHIAPVRRAQIENLYTETMVLVDEAQQAFDQLSESGAAKTDPEFAVAAVTEAMMTHARLTHIMAWLLHQRAMIAHEPTAVLGDSSMAMDDVVLADWSICHHLPEPARQVVAASERLYERIILLGNMWGDAKAYVPVQALMAQLQARL